MQLSRLRINLDIIKEIIIMAKQGFATSDRRKVEVLDDTVGAKTIGVHDCGTVFVLNNTGADAHTIPSAASCGEGWWCRFVVQSITGNQSITLGVTGDTAVLVEASADGAEDVFNLTGADPNVLQVLTAADIAGDEVEIIVANGQFFCKGISKS